MFEAVGQEMWKAFSEEKFEKMSTDYVAKDNDFLDLLIQLSYNQTLVKIFYSKSFICSTIVNYDDYIVMTRKIVFSMTLDFQFMIEETLIRLISVANLIKPLRL